MEKAVNIPIKMTQSQKDKIEETIKKERGKLFSFIRKRVPDTEDAEDILQDVFYQLINAYQMVESIEKMSSWLFRVARNKITDMYRKKKPDSFSKHETVNSEEESLKLEDILPDISQEPNQLILRDMIWLEVEKALGEMPLPQREVFVWHEFEDKSFKEISDMTGESVNTLLSRKRYAVQFLRKKLHRLYNDL